MSTPRTKRQFAGASADPAQRQITSFFASRGVEAGDVAESQPQPRQPLLPSSVQANLLSVGMRVRKSVPEGYKTCGPSAFKLWTDNTTLPERTSTPTSLRATSRELLPFCGINKIGGLDSQPPFRIDDDVDSVPEIDAVPELTMSQESADSNVSDSRKRVYNDDDFDDRPTILSLPSKGWDEEISPRSSGPASWSNSRPMAVPKTRVRKSVSFKGIDQENRSTDDDFEEAEFLVSTEAQDMEMF